MPVTFEQDPLGFLHLQQLHKQALICQVQDKKKHLTRWVLCLRYGTEIERFCYKLPKKHNHNQEAWRFYSETLGYLV